MLEAKAKIKHIFCCAQRDINQQKPDLALQSIKTVTRAVEDLGDNELQVEEKLLIAEALAAKRDPAAETFYRESLKLLSLNGQSEKELRAREHYADFLNGVVQSPLKAKRLYEEARSIAIRLGLREESDHILLKVILVDLRTNSSPEVENFKLMKRVAERHSYSASDQVSAWNLHIGLDGLETPRHARKRTEASEEHFDRLFRSLREE